MVKSAIFTNTVWCELVLQLVDIGTMNVRGDELNHRLGYAMVILYNLHNTWKILGDRIHNSPKKNLFWMTQLDLVKGYKKMVWIFHMSLEWWTWVKNDKEKIETFLENTVNKNMYKYIN